MGATHNEASVGEYGSWLPVGLLPRWKRLTALIGAVFSLVLIATIEFVPQIWSEFEQWSKLCFPAAALLVVWLPLSHVWHWLKTGEVQGGAIALLLGVGAFVVGDGAGAALILCVWTLAAVLVASLWEKSYQPVRMWEALRRTADPETAGEAGDGEIRAIVGRGEVCSYDGVLHDVAGLLASPWDESPTVSKEAGDAVYAGDVNLGEPITVVVQRFGEQTTLARAILLGRQALKWASGGREGLLGALYRWSLCWTFGAVAVTVVLPLVYGIATSEALGYGMALLALAIPGAWKAATVLPSVAATGAALRRSVIPTDPGVWERLPRLGLLALVRDAMTAGNRALVVDVLPVQPRACTPGQLLAVAAAVEAEVASGTAAGLAIRRAAQNEGIALPRAEGGRQKQGRGVSATVDGYLCLVGSAEFMEENAIDMAVAGSLVEQVIADDCLPIFCAAGGYLLGVIGVAEARRQEWPRTASRLGKMGVRLLILSGASDEGRRSAWMPDEGAWEVGLLTRQELRTLRSWAGPRVAIGVVGEAIADEEMLSQADIGMALGVSGLLTGAGHLLLPRGNLTDLPWIITLTKRLRQRAVVARLMAIAFRVGTALLVITGHMNVVGVVVVEAALTGVIAGMSMRLLGPKVRGTPRPEQAG